jgi:hypothetical protein
LATFAAKINKKNMKGIGSWIFPLYVLFLNAAQGVFVLARWKIKPQLGLYGFSHYLPSRMHRIPRTLHNV